MAKQHDQKNQEAFLQKFLTETKGEINEIKEIIKAPANSMEFLNVDISMLPLSDFYPEGTRIKIRAAKVHEIQAYSVVNDENYLDVTEKMNDLLSTCVRVTLPDGTTGSYKHTKEGDRITLIFMIRELTFQQGTTLSKEITCDKCKHEFNIPFRATSAPNNPKTFVKHEMPEKLIKFYNKNLKCFEFNIDGAIYRMAPPSIGLQEIFHDDLKTKVMGKKNTNVSFMKIIPYMLWDRTSITNDGIKAKEEEFRNMDMKTFQILTQAVDKMIFGLKGLTMTCPECGEEVHADMSFPGGASTIFVISDYFDDFIG